MHAGAMQLSDNEVHTNTKNDVASIKLLARVCWPTHDQVVHSELVEHYPNLPQTVSESFACVRGGDVCKYGCLRLRFRLLRMVTVCSTPLKLCGNLAAGAGRWSRRLLREHWF